MNKTKIEWTDWTVNPIVGCSNNCSFCYARKFGKRQKHRCRLCYEWKVHPHLERLNQLNKKQKPRNIFIDSMWDWNDPLVEEKWLIEIISKFYECSQHIFQILTKIPRGYDRFEFPNNTWLGISASTLKDLFKHCGIFLKSRHDNVKFVSIEPIQENIGKHFALSLIDWIIVGAETGNRKNKIIPKKEWIGLLVSNARKYRIPIFLKDNLNYPIKIQEFPNYENFLGVDKI